jgi:methyl-accepting chemotaxis protein
MNILNNLTVKARLLFLIALMSVVMMALSGLNLYALHQTNGGLRTVYADRTIPLSYLAEIKAKQIDNRLKIANAINDPTETAISLKKIAKSRAEIDELWKLYMQAYSAPDELLLASKFVEDRKIYTKEALEPIIEMLQNNGSPEVIQQKVIEKLRPLFVPVGNGIDALVQLQIDVAKQEYEKAQERYQFSLVSSLVLMFSGLALSER